MIAKFVSAVCLLFAVTSQETHAQWWNMGSLPGMGIGMGQQPANNFMTCIARNGNDELRVTFKETNGAWGSRFANMDVTTSLRTGQTSSMVGEYQLFVTENSRTEKVCMRESMGRVLQDRLLWGNVIVKGVVGDRLYVGQGHSASATTPVRNLQFAELAGRGVGLCRGDQMLNQICEGTIPLCCKLGYDSKPATEPFVAQNVFQGQNMMQGQIAGGFNGGMQMNVNNGQGMNGMNGGLSQGLSQGLPQGGM